MHANACRWRVGYRATSFRTSESQRRWIEVFRHMARGKQLAGNGALRSGRVGERVGHRLSNERGAGAMLRARAAIGLVALVLRVRSRAMAVFAMVVIGFGLQQAFVLAGGADADGRRGDAAQGNEREHRADEQKFQGAFHGAGC